MSRGVMQPSQQKLAEKLTILNDRGIGMLTRVYNIKKVRSHIHRRVLISVGASSLLHRDPDYVAPKHRDTDATSVRPTVLTWEIENAEPGCFSLAELAASKI
ncbi:hypothetical protein CRENBAI_001331 [Crenichthys baileyi]|uniref:Uncharacterized protein n=1 Tax=Crenichthys baileyi TaxID=28760 RepID=A0AAV9QVC2_9TELE